MRIIPHSSFTADPAVADFPALKMWFDDDDFTALGVDVIAPWTCRVTGNVASITPAVGYAILKDAEGLYSEDIATDISVSGTMPTVLATHYAVVATIGKAHASSSVNGGGGGFGVAAANVLALSTIAVANYNNAALNASPTISPATLTANAKPTCFMSYFDFVDTTSPRIDELVAANNSAAAATISSGSATTTSTTAITPGLLGSKLAISAALGTSSSGRWAKQMLFLFTSPVTLDELKLACIEMARTRKPYAGWRNKL